MTYPLQVTMHHFLIVHVYEPPGDVFELLGDLQRRVWPAVGVNPYKSEQIGVRVGPDERIDITIFHPFRHHHELTLVHRHSQ